MRERVAPDNGLVRLHGHAGDLAQHLAGREDMFADHASFVSKAIGTNPHRHHNLFQRRVPGPLADAVNRALDLARSRGYCGQSIGNRHAQIVVAVRGNSYVLNSLYMLSNRGDQVGELGGNGVADGVGNIQRCGSCLDDRLQHATQEVRVGAGRILGRKFHVLTE